MSIEYTYEIVSVDQTARCMEIVYTAPGRQTMHIGARLPYDGELLETIIHMYAPIAYWQEQEAKVQKVTVGAKGVMNKATPPTVAEAKAKKLAEIAAARYAEEVSGVFVGGVQYNASREAQNSMVALDALLQKGELSEVTWKAGGVFITHTPASFAAVKNSVVRHVQQLFSKESELVERVAAAQTVADVEAVSWDF